MSKREAEKERLEKLPYLEQDPLKTTGVLLSDQIKYYSTNYKLITPFRDDNLKPASYKLTIGNEYSVGGTVKQLSDASSDLIVIPPFEVAIIKTEETLNLPRFIIGRWNIRVHNAYKGLLWVGGPQVDPGYVGNLFCPIYNLSDKEVKLRLGDAIATIDFEKTTPFDPKNPDCKKFPRPPDRVLFTDYEPEGLRSALVSEAKTKIEEIDKRLTSAAKDSEEKIQSLTKSTDNRINNLSQRHDTVIAITFTSITILVAALAIFVTKAQPNEFTLPVWSYVTIGISIIAITVAIYAVRNKKLVYVKEENSINVDAALKIVEKRLTTYIRILSVALLTSLIVLILVVLFLTGNL